VTPDEEKVGAAPVSETSSGTVGGETKGEQEALESITKSESIFTWQNVEYTVPYNGGERKLLNGVSGKLPFQALCRVEHT